MHKFRRQWVGAMAVAGLLAGAWGCSKTAAPQEESGPPLSVVMVAQPRVARQLLSGFWTVENNAWRWTEHSFAVLLMPPPTAEQNGAVLRLVFTAPESVISRRGPVTLSATVGGVELPPETYKQPGNYVYKRDVPASALKVGTPVKVAFTTDNYLHAGEVEGRELALVVQSVGLTLK